MAGSKVKVIVLRTAGTNCDGEAVFAFQQCGADAQAVHINRLFSGQVSLQDYHVLVIPGGFTYGDDIESGRILANELRMKLIDPINDFVRAGKLVIGICNGFQVLIKSGLLPGATGNPPSPTRQNITLIYNDSGKFEDRWTHLKVEGDSVWTKGMEEVVYLPVAHAEGKFVPGDREILKQLSDRGQIALRYCNRTGGKPVYPENPNGSLDDIAGITDPSGRVLGLMPHPERHFLFEHHPFWTRLKKNGPLGQGARIFQNGVDYVRNKLLSEARG